MKIIIHSIEELKELAALINNAPATMRALKDDPHVYGPGLETAADGPRIADDSSPYVADLVAKAAAAGERIDGRPPALAEPYATDKPQADEPQADEPEVVDVDSRNIPHDARIHASTMAKNADGTWRARRGVSPELVAEVERELTGELIPQTGATRTANREAESERQQVAQKVVDDVAETRFAHREVDYDAIIEEAKVIAPDLSGDHRDLMTACQSFIANYGHEDFNALKAAACPAEGGGGKPVQALSPGERRLLQAAIGCVMQTDTPAE